VLGLPSQIAKVSNPRKVEFKETSRAASLDRSGFPLRFNLPVHPRASLQNTALSPGISLKMPTVDLIFFKESNGKVPIEIWL